VIDRDTASPQQLAYAYLRDKILSGTFPGGMWLKSEAIAKDLAISRMPVRDALRQLDAEGLVTIRVNRGAVVTNLTPEDILELFEMRAVLEGLAASLAVRRTSEADLAELDHLIAEMRRTLGDKQRWIDRHDAFHDHLCSLSGRRRLCEQIRMLRAVVRPYLLIYTVNHIDPELVGYEHELFLDSLRGGDPAHAERVVRAHVMENGRMIVAELARAQAPVAGEARGRGARPPSERVT